MGNGEWGVARLIKGLPNKKYPTSLVGWASHPPIAKGGQDVHPTRLDNLFFGNP
jgi:hypothetical protein